MIKELETYLNQNPYPGFSFDYFSASAKLYNDLDLEIQADEWLKKTDSIFKSLPENLKDQKHPDFLILQNEIKNKTNPEEKLSENKKVFEDLNPVDPGKEWLRYEIGKAYFLRNSDSLKSYLIPVSGISADSKLAAKAQFLLDFSSKPDSVSFDFSDYDKDIQSIYLKAKKSVWAERGDSLRFYDEALKNFEAETFFEKQQAKVDLLQSAYDSRFLEDQEKEDGKMIAVLVFIAAIIGYLLIRARIKLKKKEIVEESKGIVISDETEKEILQKLQDFEETTLFLDKDIRLAGLAQKLNTNTRYLSTILNKEKGKSFNAYVNTLRIQYIVSKLENDPKYLTYKISYLAEESGFVSQSSFTAAFKEETGLTPSAFIKSLKS